MSLSTDRPPYLYAPKNWPIFIIKGCLWGLSKLPYPWMLAIGATIGKWTSRLNNRNNRRLRRNLELCFSELSETARQALAVQCNQAHAMAALETAMGWWGSKRKLRKLLHMKGEEHLRAALATGRGVMLIAAHFTTLELQGVMISLLTPYSATAKHLSHPVADYLVNQARRRNLQTTLFPEDLKQVHKRLRQGEVIGFLLDQDYGAKGSVFAPFFNIPTATTTTIARLANTTNSISIPTFMYRLPKNQGYQLEFLPPFPDYPSDDPVADANKFNQAIEKVAREHPEQYGWTYKRFMTRPEGEPPLYD